MCLEDWPNNSEAEPLWEVRGVEPSTQKQNSKTRADREKHRSKSCFVWFWFRKDLKKKIEIDKKICGWKFFEVQKKFNIVWKKAYTPL